MSGLFLHNLYILKVRKFQDENMKSSPWSLVQTISNVFIHILGNVITSSYFHPEIFWPLVWHILPRQYLKLKTNCHCDTVHLHKINDSTSKLGMILENKMFENWSWSKINWKKNQKDLVDSWNRKFTFEVRFWHFLTKFHSFYASSQQAYSIFLWA